MNVAALDAIIFDFDGVLTDNRIYVDDAGREIVCCNRADGLAFDALRQTHVRVFILSTEGSPVVQSRAAKLKVLSYSGVTDKLSFIIKLAADHGFNLSRTLFVGNDLNDLEAMRACGASACPSDSHPSVVQIATFRLSSRGGSGVARELVERILALPISGVPAQGGDNKP